MQRLGNVRLARDSKDEQLLGHGTELPPCVGGRLCSERAQRSTVKLTPLPSSIFKRK